ncbi:MAG: hypothetical protein ACRDST_09525 [Pseudonocardiaceae bacterium]
MSYLDWPRITFAGRFFGDVPTINNSPGSFEPSPQAPVPLWNPGGGGTFDFLGCHVRGGESAPGSPLTPDDPALGLAVLGAAHRSSAKMVDLDPEWQRSSQIWGLSVRLADPASGEEMLSGTFRVAAFRDPWPRQTAGVAVNGQGVAASFTSVLDDVVFGPGCAGSAVLDALRQASPTPRLSIVLNPFGFFYNHVDDRFATGSLTGCIGPWRLGEPLTFVAGRRLGMGLLARPNATARVMLGPSVVAVDRDASRLVVDLGNAYPVIDHIGVPVALPLPSIDGDVTALEAGVLPSENIGAGAVLADGAATIIGALDISQAPLQAGIFSLPMAPATFAAAAQRPLALLARLPDGRRRVICRETLDGLYVRADEFVHRIDAGDGATTTLHAVRRGEPAAGVTVHLSPRAGDGSVLSLPDQVDTGVDGTATITLTAADPANPRGAIDGVVETIGYSARLAPDGSLDYAGSGLDAGLDVIVAHVRDAYPVPPDPDWERDVQPVLAQYSRLYPIMREHLVDLGDRAAVRPWRAAILLGLTRDIADPNHMPVTRDLSGPKRAAIIRWFERLPAAGSGMLRSAGPTAPATAVADATRVAPPGAAPPRDGRDAKAEAAAAAVRHALGDQAVNGTGPDED